MRLAGDGSRAILCKIRCDDIVGRSTMALIKKTVWDPIDSEHSSGVRNKASPLLSHYHQLYVSGGDCDINEAFRYSRVWSVKNVASAAWHQTHLVWQLAFDCVIYLKVGSVVSIVWSTTKEVRVIPSMSSRVDEVNDQNIDEHAVCTVLGSRFHRKVPFNIRVKDKTRSFMVLGPSNFRRRFWQWSIRQNNTQTACSWHNELIRKLGDNLQLCTTWIIAKLHRCLNLKHLSR